MSAGSSPERLSRQTLSRSPTERSGTATVWLVDGRSVSDTQLARYAGWLTPAEQERHRRFVRPLRQRQFLLGRAMLRLALGQVMQVPAEEVVLIERPGMAPLPDQSGPVPGSSLSHSGPWVACAVSAEVALGLDIEAIDPQRDVMALARQAFDDADRAWLEAQPEASRSAAFYQHWSRHEARIKLGLSAVTAVSELILPHPELAIVLCSRAPVAAGIRLDVFDQADAEASRIVPAEMAHVARCLS